MKNCFLKLIFVAVLVLFGVPAMAQQEDPAATAPAAAAEVDPQSLAMARKMMDVMHANNTFVQVIDLVAKQLIPILMKANPQQQQLVQQLFDTYFVPVFKEHVGEFTDATARIYAQNYTVDEMSQVIAFYQTPVAQKMLQKSGDMMKQVLVVQAPLRAKVVKEAVQNLVDAMRKNNLQVPKEVGL